MLCRTTIFLIVISTLVFGGSFSPSSLAFYSTPDRTDLKPPKIEKIGPVCVTGNFAGNNGEACADNEEDAKAALCSDFLSIYKPGLFSATPKPDNMPSSNNWRDAASCSSTYSFVYTKYRETFTYNWSCYCYVSDGVIESETSWGSVTFMSVTQENIETCPPEDESLFEYNIEVKQNGNTFCAKPCESPFQDDGEQCITYCPEGSRFDKSLGRCEIKKDETPQCDAQQHNPINTSTGEKQQVFTDFQQNTSLPLTFSRNYGSLRAPEPKITFNQKIDYPNKVKIIQPAGYKTPNTGWYQSTEPQKQGNVQWRHNYQMALAKYSGENIVITLNDMTQRTFSYNEILSTYSTDFPKGDSLQATVDGWLYINNNQTYYQFNLAGQLATISNVLNEKMILSYDINGKLSTITNNQNESLTYTYSPDGLLTEVTQPDGNIIFLTYDGYNNLSVVTYPDDTENDFTDNPRQIYHYENATHPYALTGITDEKGVRFATWNYNDIGQATNSSHTLNTDTGMVDYDNANRSIHSTNSLNNTTSITFDIAGRVSTVNGASCSTSGEKGTSSFTYNSQGQVELHTDESNAVTYKTYETSGIAQGKVNKIVELYGTEDAQSTEMTYDTGNVKPTQIIRPNGLMENFVYGINHRLESHSLTTGNETRTTTYSYNADGQLASIDGSRVDVSDITTFTYINNRLSTRTNALGYTITFENYNAFGNATKITDVNGAVTNLGYDVRGRLTSTTTSLKVFTFEYDAIGQLTKVTTPSGSSLSYIYNDARRLIKITNALGESINFTHDSEGNITKRELKGADDSITNTQQFVFDSINRLSQTVSAASQTWTNTYDVAGNLTKQQTPATTDIENTFDQLKRVTKQLDQADSSTDYEYNKLNRLTKVTDALSRSTTYEYNVFGEITKQTSADSGITTFTYDSVGNISTRTDARGIVTTYSYDVINRLTQISYPDTSENVIYTYDNADVGRYGKERLTKVTDQSGSIEYYYNIYGEATKEVRTLNTQPDNQSYTTEYTYNLDGQVSKITYPSNRSVDYTYNLAGSVTQVSTTQSSVTQILASNISYVPFGSMKSLTYGNSKTLTQSYNLDYQLMSKQVTGIIDKTYAYDVVSNINKITDNLDANSLQDFTYDSVERLTSASGNYGSLAYTYDAIGNRTEKSRDSVADTYTYTNGKLSQTSQIAITYDTMGNTTQRGNDSYAYNQTGRLSIATIDSNAYQYTYNYLGQRVVKETGTDTRHYQYGLSGELLAEFDGSGNVKVEYVYLNGKRIAFVTDAIYYVHTNHIDTPLALTNQTGNLVWKASYTPFGKIDITTDLLSEKLTARFPGQYSDIETGLYYNYFRDYDPELGRYIQSDPIGLAGGINTYGYVGGNPISYYDIYGLDSISISANFQIPSFISNMFSDVKGINGLHSGIAIEFPGPNGGGWDIAGFFGPDFMQSVGLGKATLSLGYDKGGICELTDLSGEVSALIGLGEYGATFDPDTGALTGGHVGVGLAPGNAIKFIKSLVKGNSFLKAYSNNMISGGTSTNVLVGSLNRGTVK
tara:strand:+ start:1126 stop:5742 length:4617 start_codon:yes stop_codon:yes gene_type:complete